MAKEIMLIIAVIVSLALIVVTIPKIVKLNASKGLKTVLIYVTILVPVLGFFITKSLAAKTN